MRLPQEYLFPTSRATNLTIPQMVRYSSEWLCFPLHWAFSQLRPALRYCCHGFPLAPHAEVWLLSSWSAEQNDTTGEVCPAHWEARLVEERVSSLFAFSRLWYMWLLGEDSPLRRDEINGANTTFGTLRTSNDRQQIIDAYNKRSRHAQQKKIKTAQKPTQQNSLTETSALSYGEETPPSLAGQVSSRAVPEPVLTDCGSCAAETFTRTNEVERERKMRDQTCQPSLPGIGMNMALAHESFI